MTTNRREFIERLGATAMVGALPLTSLRTSDLLAMPAAASTWDTSWMAKVRAKARAAGFTLSVCRDLFIHHFGARTFAKSAPAAGG